MIHCHRGPIVGENYRQSIKVIVADIKFFAPTMDVVVVLVLAHDPWWSTK